MERGLMFAHRAVVEHEVLQRILVTEPEILLPQMTTNADQTQGLVACVPFAVSRAPWHDRGGGPRHGRRLPRPHGALVHRVTGSVGPQRPRAGGAARPVRAARWYPVSGPAPEPAPPPPCYRHPDKAGPVVLRALRPPHLHGLHGVGRGRLAVPGVHDRRGRRRSRQVPAFTHTSPGRTGVVGSTNPTPLVLAIIVVERRRLLPGAFRQRRLRRRQVLAAAARCPLPAPVLPGVHGDVPARQLPAHPLQHDRPAHRRAAGRGAARQGALPRALPARRVWAGAWPPTC